MKYSKIIIFGLIFLLCGSTAYAADWMINEDYQQRDNRAASDFEIVLKGKVKSQITGGGQSSITNPFDNPTRTIVETAIGNTKITFKGSNSIPKNTTADRHFGIWGTGQKPKVLFKAWSYATSPFIIPVPKSNFSYLYDPNTGQLTITVENLTEETVTFSDVGYLLSPVERPIADLTRAVLPAESFIPLPSLNQEYLPGEARSIMLDEVPPTDFVIGYATVTFTGGSADNPYNEDGVGTGGEWSQVSVGTQTAEDIPTLNEWGMIILGFLLLIALISFVIRRNQRPVMMGMAIFIFIMLASSASFGLRWVGGPSWTAGQHLKVCVDTPPGDAQQQSEYLEAVFEAMAEWNEVQAVFGGLILEYATEDCDINISWHNNRTELTTMGVPVQIDIGYDGLNARGITRVLKHELGHAESLDHSANSVIMREDAYSSDPPNGPSDTDLNSGNKFPVPNADDIGVKRSMYGTTPAESKSDAKSSATEEQHLWRYDYSLAALLGPGYIEPVTRFTLELPSGVGLSDFSVTLLPAGWEWDFVDAYVTPGGRFANCGTPAPSVLNFSAIVPEDGVPPGDTVFFQITSPLSPEITTAYTNSPRYNSDEFAVVVPHRVIPTLNEWGMIIMFVIMAAGVVWFVVRNRRRMAAA